MAVKINNLHLFKENISARKVVIANCVHADNKQVDPQYDAQKYRVMQNQKHW